tara:strand:+ start:157 stop:564 length:408 start_codon:yes stop_codon:yes gene_type:complete
MASILKVDTLTGNTTAKTVTVTVGATATQSLEQGLVKAWAMIATVSSINDSLNSSSFTDLGTGKPQVNLTNAFSDADNCCGAANPFQYASGTAHLAVQSAGFLISTSAMGAECGSNTTTLVNWHRANIFMMGDLA